MIKFYYFQFVRLKLSARKAFSSCNSTFRYRDISDNEKSIAKRSRGSMSEEKCGSSDTYCTFLGTDIYKIRIYPLLQSLCYFLTSSLFHLFFQQNARATESRRKNKQAISSSPEFHASSSRYLEISCSAKLV